MADFIEGDRVVKMCGAAAGKFGTVKNVFDDGTLNVIFDGERLPRFCDPERCGKVAANAKYKLSSRDAKVGDYVRVATMLGNYIVTKVNGDKIEIKDAEDGTQQGWVEARFATPIGKNSRAANAKFKVGDVVIDRGFPGIKMKIVQVDSRFDPNSRTYAVKPLRGGAVTSSREEDLRLANSRAANAVARNDMFVLEKGDRVKIKRTGEKGIVTHVYESDDAISVMRDNGTGTILRARDLEWIG